MKKNTFFALILCGVSVYVYASFVHQAPFVASQTILSNVVQTAHSVSDDFSVVRVVDGDTIVVNVSGKEERVRLIGIDTPETVDPRKPVQCFGKEASEETKKLLLSGEVILKGDPTQNDRDRYGRLLRYVYTSDGLFVNKMLVAEGYAHEYTYRVPYEYQVEFKKAERDARTSGKGLWATSSACQ